MACVRKRRGKWVADYRDGFGRRCWITKETRREAEEALGEKLRTTRNGRRAQLHPDTKVVDFVPYWLKLTAARDLDPRTVVAYERILNLHVLPTLGARKVREIQSAELLDLCAEKLNSKALGRASVQFLLAVLRSAFDRAAADGLVDRNPAERLGRTLNLGRSRGDKQAVKAFTRAERDRLLETIRRERPKMYPAVLLMTHAGLRIGEVAALEWTDCDLDPTRRTLTVHRTFSHGVLKPTTKSGKPRTVPLTPHLRDVLARYAVVQKREALRRGWGEVPPWVFSTVFGTRLDVRTFEHAFKRLLAKANLPPHHTPHNGRHTFATLLLRAGVPVEYVKRRLGHASIALTADVYGQWLPESDQPAWTPKPGQTWVDVLDTPGADPSDESGSNSVAAGE